MIRKLSGFTIFLAVAFAAGISAHPLGNFSVNQYSRLEIGKSQVTLYEVVDMAEIPTFQESAVIDTNRDGKLSQDELTAYATNLGPQYAANLRLTAGGESLPVRVSSSSASVAIGEGDLNTLRISWTMVSDLPMATDPNRIIFHNDNNAGRLGWNEIVVNSTGGVRVFDSTAYGNSNTDELRSFPQESLTSPLSERKAEFSFAAGAMPPDAKPLQNRDGAVSRPVQKDRLAELINVPEITPIVALFGLLIAFGLGAAHAMSPGHGKTVVGAYLVGSKVTPKHAVFLGLTVTVTHTLGVFALGLITLFASNYILPEKLMPFLGFVSGLLVFFIGISLFKDRLFSLVGWKKPAHDYEHHGHEHGHNHEGNDTHSHDGGTHTHGGSTHSHAVPDEITWRSLLALGISGGLLPCPSALVLMLSAISLGRIGYGLVLTIAFSFGLAATLTIVGLVFLNIGNFFGKTAIAQNPVFRMLPVFSALVVAFVGAVICYNALG